MMMHAYRETYLNSAMRNTGDMFDYAINGLGIPAEDFVRMFITSNVCRRMENGEVKYIMGMSGMEIAIDVIEEKTGMMPEPDNRDGYYDTPDYWCGWALCYYQWLRALSYKMIFKAVTYDEILSLYRTLHEADVGKFAAAMDERLQKARSETKLKQIRNARGYSQSRLAKESGVMLRSIQMYEQRNKDINKGQSETILRLARTLGCSMEDLLEPAFVFSDKGDAASERLFLDKAQSL